MMNFNDAAQQSSFELIPANTIAKARLVIKFGADQLNPWVTLGKNNESSYLNCEFIILEGPHAKRKVFDKIGISGSDIWVNMGKARIRAILESAKGIDPKDMSDIAIRARQIDSFGDLNNLDLVIKIGIDRDKTGQYDDKNRVIAIITPDHMSYTEYMNGQDIPWSV